MEDSLDKIIAQEEKEAKEAAEKPYVDRKDIVIENDIAIWKIEKEGFFNGTYAGIFKFRCFLSPSQILQAGREYRELLGPHELMAERHETLLAYALAQLKQRVLQAPPWWSATIQNGTIAGDIPDEDVLTAILDAAWAAQVKYAHMLKKRKEDAITRAKRAAKAMIDSQDAPAIDEDEE